MASLQSIDKYEERYLASLLPYLNRYNEIQAAALDKKRKQIALDKHKEEFLKRSMADWGISRELAMEAYELFN